ncbi:MAG: PAS domain-containing protein [Proteobacteria bacterium]|nr:PAS domain-containing protein [Pseudomonadota bacterium]
MNNSSAYDILHSLNDPALIVDKNYRIIFANQHHLELCEMAKEQVLGQKCHEIHHHCPNPCEKATLADQPCPHRQVFSSGLPITIRHLHTMTDESTKEFEITTTPLFDENGKVDRILQVMKEITEQQLLKHQLQTAKDEWEKTFDAMSDIITLMDKEFRIIRANKATYNFFKVKPGEINGKYCYELFRGADEPCPDCPVFDTIQDAGCHHREKIAHAKLEKIFHVSSAPIFNSEGEVQYLVHIAKDITDLTKLQEDLFQAHKMEAIGALAGGIAHDFNNILTAILGYTELARADTPHSSHCTQYLDQVLKAGDRARGLISQILTFSRKHPQQIIPMCPVIIVKEVIKLLRASLPSTVEIRDTIDPQCGSIMADPIQVHQILVNLCTNAFQAMPDQKGIIIISLSQTTGSKEALVARESPLPLGSLIKLEVTDTGSGMNQATKERIFDPYFTTKEIGKGTGMGLAVVHGIVNSHGGSMRVTSELGKGTTFSVFFPSLPPQTKLEEQEINQIPIPTGNESILLVDDEIAIVTMQQSVLERLGYHVVVKTTSNDALSEFQSHPDQYDLVITDQTMPDITGAELAISLLQIKPGLPIILCTGYSAIISEEDTKRIGIKKFITKPVTSTELATIVRQVLDGQR